MVLLLISLRLSIHLNRNIIFYLSLISTIGARAKHRYDEVNAILLKRGLPVCLVVKAITDDLFSRKIK